MSDDELITLHDAEAPRVSLGGTSWVVDELARRRVDRQTRAIVWLTVAIFVLTLANTAFIIYAALA